MEWNDHGSDQYGKKRVIKCCAVSNDVVGRHGRKDQDQNHAYRSNKECIFKRDQKIHFFNDIPKMDEIDASGQRKWIFKNFAIGFKRIYDKKKKGECEYGKRQDQEKIKER
ncbi:hypothetical protein [Paenibacillus vietnamensis]|uniref:hypothetical protein n=1 Tax=Paenibacillus vietnamensis TaxID=2590547 RepID=UPI001CD10798|nr:hypothetical protein [Paenibacillus vietnamensis]